MEDYVNKLRKTESLAYGAGQAGTSLTQAEQAWLAETMFADDQLAGCSYRVGYADHQPPGIIIEASTRPNSRLRPRNR